jgi:hypothetical protein
MGRLVDRGKTMRGGTMNCGKSMFGLVGMLTLVLGLTAFAPPMASAGWKLVNAKGELKEITEALLPSLQVKEIENADAAMKWTTKGGTAVDHLCKEAELIGAKMQVGGTSSSAKIRFKQCVTLLNGTVSKSCEPHVGASKGIIETNAGRVTIKEGLLSFSSESGSFATMEMGELCAIGEVIPVNGTLFLKDCQGSFTTELVAHLFEEDKSSSITVLGIPASMAGSVLIELSGEHKGLKWGA